MGRDLTAPYKPTARGYLGSTRRSKPKKRKDPYSQGPSKFRTPYDEPEEMAPRKSRKVATFVIA